MTPPGSEFGTADLGGMPAPSDRMGDSQWPLPQAIAYFGAIVLLGTVLLEMVAAAVQALTEPAGPSLVGTQGGPLPLRPPQASLSVFDRLSVFARSGANLMGCRSAALLSRDGPGWCDWPARRIGEDLSCLSRS